MTQIISTEFRLRRVLQQGGIDYCTMNALRSIREAGTRARILQILLVDDHPFFRLGLRRELSCRRWLRVVGEASSAWEAVAQTSVLSPDVVLLDSSLPELDPEETIAMLRKSCAKSTIVVFTLSSTQRPTDRDFCGADSYLPKTANPLELLRILRKIYKGEGCADSARSVRPTNLTARELETLRLTVRGLSTGEVAAAMSVRKRTVEAHRAHLMEKLKLHSRVEMVRYAVTAGICADQELAELKSAGSHG